MRPSSTPSTKILPLEGFSSRISRRTRVDLPAPDGPTRKRKSPSGTSRLMSRRASVPVGYVLWTCWKLITGRVAKSGVKSIGCVSCCGVSRRQARAARSRAVYPKVPQAPNPSSRAKHWSNEKGLGGLRGLLSDSRDYPVSRRFRPPVSRDYPGASGRDALGPDYPTCELIDLLRRQVVRSATPLTPTLSPNGEREKRLRSPVRPPSSWPSPQTGRGRRDSGRLCDPDLLP